jgi:hypothetical protein
MEIHSVACEIFTALRPCARSGFCFLIASTVVQEIASTVVQEIARGLGKTMGFQFKGSWSVDESYIPDLPFPNLIIPCNHGSKIGLS